MTLKKEQAKGRKRASAIIDPTACTGCAVCAMICPVNCIILIESESSFNGIAKVNLDICTGCNLCAIYCPWETITMKKSDGSFVDYSKQLARSRGYV